MSAPNYDEPVLDILHDGPCTIADISSDLGVSSETVRRVIYRLSARCLVEVMSRITHETGGPPQYVYSLTRTRKGGRPLDPGELRASA